jgi:hypothetical protein
MEDTPGQAHLNMLVAEYKTSLQQSSHLAMRMEAAALGGFALLTLLTAFLFYFRASIPVAIAWTAPLAYLVVFGALLGLASQQVAAAWQGRIFGLQLARLSSQPLPAPADPLNQWRTSWKLRLLAGVPAAVFSGLFLLTGYFCARSIYHHSHIQGSGFILFYALLALVELAALGSLYYDLPRLYRSAYQSVAAGGDLPALHPTGPLATIGAWLAPFPAGLLDHSRAFWAGFLAPLLLVGLSKAQLPILNNLLRGLTDWQTVAEVPILAVVALGVLVFLVLVLLLDQAVNLLEGLRRGSGGVPFPALQMVLRWLAALLLAAALGWRGLLPLFLVISVYEIIGLLLIRPNSGRHPVIGLLWSSAGLPLRFAAGVLVWGGPAWDYAVYLMLAVFVYFLGLGLSAAARRREAQARAAQGLAHDEYIRQHGAYWRQVGLWSALASGGLIFFAQLLTENCRFTAKEALGKIYGFCGVNSQPVYTLIAKLDGFLVAFDMLVVMLLVMMLLVWLVAWRPSQPKPAAAAPLEDLEPPAPPAVPDPDAAPVEAPAEAPDPGLAASQESVPLPEDAAPSPRPAGMWNDPARFYYLIALLVVLIGFLRFSAAWAFGGVEIAVLGAIVSRE